MFEAARFLYLYVESPLHAGSGRGLGAVDLPIQRERVTQYPLVQASGIKGALRSVCERKADPIGLEYVFGTTDHAGAVSPGDARLLLFPVRSLNGVFAWTTSVDALMRFRRDALAIGEELPWTVPNSPGKNDALVTMDPSVEAGGKVVLEEYAFTPDRSEAETITKIAEWIANNALPNGDEYEYWKKKLPTRLVVLHEDAYCDFTQFATEVLTRIKLDSTSKTVNKKEGALWTEESLPVDTLLYAPLAATPPRYLTTGADPRPTDLRSATAVLNLLATWLDNPRIQLGGDETVGRGTVSLRFGKVNAINGKGGSHA